jgi:arylsulfatase A-like enzyme
VAFTHAFVTVPVCTPARAELLTGRSATRNGVTYFGQAIRPAPRALAEAGYHTWFTGKWHNDGTPEQHGFREARRVFRGGMGDHRMTLTDRGEKVSGFSSELFADAAVDFLRGHPQGPWFADVAFTAPHDPRTPPPPYDAMYDPATNPLPPYSCRSTRSTTAR